jgi:phytoene dehydrogenase-like protein
VLLPDSYEAIRRSFDDLRCEQLCSHPLLGLGSLTMFDPTRAPAGRAIPAGECSGPGAPRQ